MELKEQITKAILELRTHGLSYGGTIGYHAGWCDDVADRLANTLALITSQEQRIKELAEENARLIDAGFDTVDFAIEKKRDAKSDTVRKMQERLTSCFCPDCDYSGHDVRRVIDQIAKERLEGG